jgi:hypothetical protein
MPSITHNEPFFFLPLSRSGTSPRRPCSLEWRRPRRSRVPPAAHPASPNLLHPTPASPVLPGVGSTSPPLWPRWCLPQIHTGARSRRRRPVRTSPAAHPALSAPHSLLCPTPPLWSIPEVGNPSPPPPASLVLHPSCPPCPSSLLLPLH